MGHYRDAGTPDSTPTGVFDIQTAAAGAMFQVTRTGEDSYDVLLDPFGPGASYTLSETFANPGVPVNWIEFTFFNTLTDTGTPPTFETDFYIRSIEITDSPGEDADFDGDGDVDGGDFLKWQRGVGLTGQANNSHGDANGDGSVGAADLSIWRTQFGVGPLVAAAATIPEPTCFSLLLAAGLVPLRFGRRARDAPVAVRGYHSSHWS